MFVLFAALFPRLALLIFWMARPNAVDDAFSSWAWPVLGFLFFPLGTLVYVLLHQSGLGLTDWEWAWVAIALLLDVGHWGAGARQRTRRA
ncbi:hypothetical protein [Streptomyces coryli]|uniref:hypothetical protein n=1 Tax=Streptomyces coryli TaxID=1128680 RepID=UPI0019D1930D|nr:hypothetical protein [Streptomyces coryli]